LVKKPQQSNRIDLLEKISNLLDETERLDSALGPILQVMATQFEKDYGLSKLALALTRKSSGRIEIEETYGITEAEKQRGKYKSGEGIIGRVLESGEVHIVDDVGKSKLMLHRAISRKDHVDHSFICVPIKHESFVIGTLSGLFVRTAPSQLEEHAKFFSIIASLIARASAIRRLDEERRQLADQLRERFRPDNIIGSAKAMQLVYDQIAQVAVDIAQQHVMIHRGAFVASGPICKIGFQHIPRLSHITG